MASTVWLGANEVDDNDDDDTAVDGLFILTFPLHSVTISSIVNLYFSLKGASGILTKPPVNVLAKSGTEVRLRCSTNLTDPVYWLRRLHGNSETQTLYYGAFGFSSSVNGRFRIDGSRSNDSYDVIISRVRAEDAGVYICQDDGGMGERKEMELVVFGAFDQEKSFIRYL